MKKILPLFFLSISIFSAGYISADPVKVNVLNYVRAESDSAAAKYAKIGGFGKFFHLRVPTPIDQQDIIRMNRDTLYSAAILDLTSPATIVKPNTQGRFQSMLVISQDHSMLPVEHGAGRFFITKEKVGTRYAIVIIRTFMDANNPEDIKMANELQNQLQVIQNNPGTFEVPEWDEVSLKETREKINALAVDIASGARGLFGNIKKMDPIKHLLGAAYGWGGNPDEAALYSGVTPAINDGETAYILKVNEVPVKGFWSITVYNEKGFMQKNDLDRYSINNVTAEREADGSVIIRFGGDSSKANYIPITKGWNYIVRMYQPEKILLDGKWKFPDATLASN